jgi:hypothetical protein
MAERTRLSAIGEAGRACRGGKTAATGGKSFVELAILAKVAEGEELETNILRVFLRGTVNSREIHRSQGSG